jgi:hypothetical protein
MKKPGSYMELCWYIDGKENVYLRIPTLWDAVKNQWIGFIKTPKTQRLIHGEGKNSFDLQNSFTKCMSELIHENEELGEEIKGMFMPSFFWEKV